MRIGDPVEFQPTEPSRARTAPRRWRTRLLAGILILGVVLRQCVFPGSSFDALRWQADVAGGGDRFAMADRFVARGGLLGRSREEVVRMLGPSTEHDEFLEWDLIYYLGSKRPTAA